MADNDLSVNTVKVGELGVTDHVEGSDKFLMSRPGDGEDSDVTYTAEANGIYAGAAESDPVVNKIYEIAKEPATRTVVGAVKPGIGLDVRTDGTLDSLTINKNLLFGGDDLTAGLLYNEDTGEYYYPNGIELPVGMYYTFSDCGNRDGNYVSDSWNKVATINAPLSYSETGKIGKTNFVPDHYVNNDGTYLKYDDKIDPSRTDSLTYGEAGDFGPICTKKLSHLVKWDTRGLYMDSNAVAADEPNDTIMLTRISSMRDQDMPVLDLDHRSFTVTFKVTDSWQSAEQGHIRYFTCSFDAQQRQTSGILTDKDGNTLGKLIIYGQLGRQFAVDKSTIDRSHTGVINGQMGYYTRGLYWRIGKSTNASHDYDCTYNNFEAGTAFVLGIKIEYGTLFTGFENDYYTNFSSKESYLNQCLEKVSENAVVKIAKETRDAEDTIHETGKIPDVIFKKTKPPMVFSPWSPSTQNNFGDEYSQHWYDGDLFVGQGDFPKTMGGPDIQTSFRDGYIGSYTEDDPETGVQTETTFKVFGVDEERSGIDPQTGSPYGPFFPEAVLRQRIAGSHDDYLPANQLSGVFNQNRSDPSFPITNSGGKDGLLKIADMLKTADQYFSGNITINSEHFRLEDRKIKVSNGLYRLELISRSPSEEDPTKFNEIWKWRCLAAPTFSTVTDMLCLRMAGKDHLGGVCVDTDNPSLGITFAGGGKLKLNTASTDYIGGVKIGSGLSIASDGTISVTGGGGGGASIDDTTTASDKTWSSNKINTELGTKQANLNAGANITLTPQLDGTVTIASSGGGGGSSTLSGLSDVNLSSLSQGQCLKYDSTSSKWINASFPTPSMNLDDLTDVESNNPSDESLLMFSSTLSKWVPVTGRFVRYMDFTATLAAGSTSLLFNDSSTTGFITSDKTVEVFTETYGVNPTNVEWDSESNGIRVTFEAQPAALSVKVRVTV